MIDIIGLAGGACIIGAMLTKKLIVIRWLLLVGASLLLIYSIVLNLLPIIILNGVGSAVGIRGVIQIHRQRSK